MKRAEASLVVVINVKLRLFNKYEATRNTFGPFQSVARNRNSAIRVRVQRPLTFYRMGLVGNYEVLDL